MKRFYRYGILSVLLVLMLASFVPQEAGGDDLSVIISPNNTEKEFTIDRLKKIIRARDTRWPDNKSIKLAIMHPDTRDGQITAFKIFGFTSEKMNKYYMQLVFQGKIISPEFFKTQKELIDYVNKTDGAIGIVGSSFLQENQKAKVDGKGNF